MKRENLKIFKNLDQRYKIERIETKYLCYVLLIISYKFGAYIKIFRYY